MLLWLCFAEVDKAKPQSGSGHDVWAISGSDLVRPLPVFDTSPASQDWLAMLERLQEAPSTRTVYVLGIPTARVPDADHITSYKSRNRVRPVALGDHDSGRHCR